jgi:hypothetical protein
MAEIEMKRGRSLQKPLPALTEGSVENSTFSRSVSFKVNPRDKVKISFTGSYSGDLSLNNGLTGRHAHGIAKADKKELPGGMLEYRIQVEKNFPGHVQLDVNGNRQSITRAQNTRNREHTVRPQARSTSQSDQWEHTSSTPEIKTQEREKTDLSGLSLPKVSSLKATETITERVEPIPIKNETSNKKAVVREVQREVHPAYYDLLSKGLDSGVEVRITNFSTNDRGTSVRTLQAYRKDLESGRFEPIGASIELAGSEPSHSKLKKLGELLNTAIKNYSDEKAAGEERLRNVPGLSGRNLNHLTNPVLADIASTARRGGIDIVLTSETKESVTLRLWCEDLKRYSPEGVTLPKSEFEAKGSTTALSDLSKQVDIYRKRGAWMLGDRSGVSDIFLHAVLDSSEKVPRQIINELIKSGTTINIVQNMSDRKELLKSPPRGREHLVSSASSPENRIEAIKNAWNTVGGVYLSGSRSIVMDEGRFLREQSKITDTIQSNLRLATLHELGHAVDHLLGEDSRAKDISGGQTKRRMLSSSDMYMASYIRDKNQIHTEVLAISPTGVRSPSSQTASADQMSNSPRNGLEYYLNEGGEREIFASLFALLMEKGNPSSAYARMGLHHSFKNTLSVVEQAITDYIIP